MGNRGSTGNCKHTENCYPSTPFVFPPIPFPKTSNMAAFSPSSETTGHFWPITRPSRQSRAITPLVNPKAIRFQVTVVQIYEVTWRSQLQSWVSPLNGNCELNAAWPSPFSLGLAKCVLRVTNSISSVSFSSSYSSIRIHPSTSFLQLLIRKTLQKNKYEFSK